MISIKPQPAPQPAPPKTPSPSASFINEAMWDRVIRVGLGIALLYLGWTGLTPGVLGTVLKYLGFVPLITGLAGWCPAYSVFGIKTCRS